MNAETLLFLILLALALLPLVVVLVIVRWPVKPTPPPLPRKPYTDLTPVLGNAKLGTRNAETGGVWERNMYSRDVVRVG